VSAVALLYVKICSAEGKAFGRTLRCVCVGLSATAGHDMAAALLLLLLLMSFLQWMTTHSFLPTLFEQAFPFRTVSRRFHRYCVACVVLVVALIVHCHRLPLLNFQNVTRPFQKPLSLPLGPRNLKCNSEQDDNTIASNQCVRELCPNPLQPESLS
jgi:hypothetical protein